MTHLSLEQLYAYLEGDLSAREKQDIEAHLSLCPDCRNAAEERRRIIQAVETLPALDVPPDFAKGIMNRISMLPKKAKVTVFGWLAAGAAGFLAFTGALAVFVLVSGQSLSGLFIRLNHGIWSYIKDAASATAKIAKFLILAFKIAWEFLGGILEGLGKFASLISPEAQVIFICSLLLLVFGAAILWRRRLILEKHHEK